MEEKNLNLGDKYETDVGALTKQFQDYENQKKTSKQKREELLLKIFNPRKTKETFRILPPKRKNTNFYATAYFHSVNITTTGGNKKRAKIYCLKKNDHKVPQLDNDGNEVLDENGEKIMVFPSCPLCDKHDRIMGRLDESVRYKKREVLNNEQKKIFDENKKIFKEAKYYEAAKFFIVKGIDRKAEDDGPKFWRFRDSFTNRGVMDKLKTVLMDYVNRYGKDFMSPINGTDLSIMMTDARTPAGVSYKDISTIQCSEPCPLSKDEHIANFWLNDPSTWREVFKPKKAPNITPYEYLEFLANGMDPYYDETLKRWVFPDRPDLEALANKRDSDLTANKSNEEYASDLDDDVNISNISESDVGEYKDDSVNVGEEVLKDKEDTKKKSDDDDDSFDDIDDIDDLPF